MADRPNPSNSCGVAEIATLFKPSRDNLKLSVHLHSGKKIRVVNFFSIETRQKNEPAQNVEDGKILLSGGLRDFQFFATSPVGQLAELSNGSLPLSQPEPSTQNQ